MTIEIKEKSTKTVLLAIAEQLEKIAIDDTVKDRKYSALLVAKYLRTMAESLAVKRLLDFME